MKVKFCVLSCVAGTLALALLATGPGLAQEYTGRPCYKPYPAPKPCPSYPAPQPCPAPSPSPYPSKPCPCPSQPCPCPNAPCPGKPCGPGAVVAPNTSPFISVDGTFGGVSATNALANQQNNNVIAVPVIVPAFQFQYTPPAFQQYSTGPAYSSVPYAGGPQAAYPPGGYSYGTPAGTPMAGAGGNQAPAQPNPQEYIRMLAKEIVNELRAEQARMASSAFEGNGPPAVPGTTPPAMPSSGGGLPKAPTGGSPGSTPGQMPPAGGNKAAAADPGNQPYGGRVNKDQVAALAFNALTRNCAGCHTGGAAKGDMVLFLQPGVLNPDAPFSTIRKVIESGRMPPRASQYRITQEELNVIREWLNTK